MRTRTRQNVLNSVAVIALAALPFNALAGNPSFTAPDQSVFDPNGVDLLSMHLDKNKPMLSIGDPNDGGLAWVLIGHQSTDSYGGAVVYATNNQATGNPLPVVIDDMRFKFGGSTDSFDGTCAGACKNLQIGPATLVKAGSNYLYTAKDGAVYKLTAEDTPNGSSNYFEQFIGKLISITKPNGATLSINYESSSPCSYIGTCYRIKSVISNEGFALKYDYPTTGFSVVPNKIWAVNLLAHTCNITDPANLTCDAYDNYVTVGPNGFSATDALNFTTSMGIDFIDNVDPLDETYVDGAHSYQPAVAGQTSIQYDVFGRATTYSDPRGTWKYTYSDNLFDDGYNNVPPGQAVNYPSTRTITVKDPDNALVLTALVHKGNQYVSSVTDALNRTTLYGHTPTYLNGVNGKLAFPLTRITKPEGDNVAYTLDSRGNATAVITTPKAGSGLSATSISASYPTTCTYPKTCNQPIWTKDAKLNQTDDTYDNNHGGVLTVTLPADQNSVRTRTYNTYTAFDTGNGIIYRLTRTETCGLTAAQLSLTACPALATTSVTLTDYGTSTTAPKTYKSSLPYQVTQTDGASSLSAVTTYAYDNIGNVISVDGPLSGTADQSFFTYDANRHKIFEIGPIPGGSGTQKRTLARHQYNGDGQETQTAQGYASSNLTTGTDAVFTSYTQMNYDTAGRLIRSQTLVTGNVVP